MRKFRLVLVLGALSSTCVFLLYSFSYNTQPFQNKYVFKNYKRSLSYETETKFDKWIVVTSVSYPTEQVKYLSQIPGWRLVVVGDRKTPLNWSLPGCDYLSLDTQRELGFTLTAHLPFASYARKNIGYLYAVLHGAKFIYETDDDNSPQDNLKGFILNSTTPGLMFIGNDVFNPYHHFGQSTLWPRGYPLTHIGRKQNNQYEIGSNWDTPTIQQGLVNGDPDMDAIFRLSRKSASTILNVTFDPLAPPVILPEGVFSPFNSQNTLFHHAAFWALFIPTTTTFRVCDIWRGYWAQRLMWEVGGRLAFFPANAFQKRNSHSYLDDADQEKDMYFQTENLLLFLRNWFCEETFSFFQCVIKLTTDMAKHSFWRHDDVMLVKRWLEDLKSMGYIEPTRIQINLNFSNFNSSDKIASLIYQTKYAKEKKIVLNHVMYSPIKQQPPSLDADSSTRERIILKAHKILSMCENFKNISLSQGYFGEMKNKTFFSDILLILVFNHPYYSNVRYLDAIHSLVFTYIVYCGDNRTKFIQETGDLGKTLTFIEFPVDKGYDGHMCTVKAMEMGYNVKGYLVAGDDVLVKPWALLAMNKSHGALTFNTLQSFVLNISLPTARVHWWRMKLGREAYLKTIEDLNAAEFPPDVKSLSDFQNTTLTHTKYSDLVSFGLSDFYYFPASMKPSAIWYMTKFYQNRLFLEITVPVVMCGLETRAKIYRLPGMSVGGERRSKIVSFYKDYKMFIHPAKLSQDDIIAGYCRDYFPELLEKMFDIK